MLKNATIKNICESIALFAPAGDIALKYQTICELNRLKSELILQGIESQFDKAADAILTRLQGAYGITINLD